MMYPKIPLCLLVKIVLCFDSLKYKTKKKQKKWNFDLKSEFGIGVKKSE